MAYHLGVDLGTTYTAAAIERNGRVEAVTLGNRQVSVPSVLFLKSDGEVLVGDAADRRGASEPSRVAREFKRRVGDPTPVLLGGVPYAAETLMAKLLRWVVERVVEIEGGPPAAIALTHPANWGPFKLDLLRQAARHANVGVARYLTEPEAAATSYASHERVEPGAVIAVYDLGGGTFDATVLRKRADGFDILGQPEGVERLGGIDFDVAVFNHVWNGLGAAVVGLDVEDAAVIAAVARLRRECVAAKEALSADTDVSIPVSLPTVQTEVRLTRNELESMIRPTLADTVVSLRRAIDGAGVGPEQISAVLLVGGSSRIPLVSQLIASSLGRPIAVDANPKDAICLGAAVAAAQAVGAATPESVTPVVAPVVVSPPPPPAAPAPLAPTAPPAPAPLAPAPLAPAPVPAADRPTRPGLVAALVGLAILLGTAAYLVVSGGDDDPDDLVGGNTTTTEEERTTTTGTAEEAVTTSNQPTTTDDPYDAIEAQFVADCVDDQVSAGELDQAGAEGFCECSFDRIRATIEFDRFRELNDEARATGRSTPEIDRAIQPCVDAF